MKIQVDQNLCQGHTICAMLAPDVFTLRDEDGHSDAIEGEIPAALQDSAREAVFSCPERAIAEISEHAVQGS